jgi:hypothetical protein
MHYQVHQAFCPVLSTNAFYSASSGFISRPKDPLSFLCFFSPSTYFWDGTSKLSTTASFHSLTNSLIINHATFRRYVAWVTDSIITDIGITNK